MASMHRDVIMMLFAGDYCSAHTAEKQDTSTKIAGKTTSGAMRTSKERNALSKESN